MSGILEHHILHLSDTLTIEACTAEEVSRSTQSKVAERSVEDNRHRLGRYSVNLTLRPAQELLQITSSVRRMRSEMTG